MSDVLARTPPGCLAHLSESPDGTLWLSLAAHAGAWLSFHPDARFTGPPCRPEWRFPPPEELFERERPDVRSDLYSLGVTLLALRQGPRSPGVPGAGTVAYAQWALDDGAARAWDQEAGVAAPVRALLARCAARSRKHRPADTDALRAALLEVWPETAADAFPVFRLRPARLSRAAWLAAARALPGWQLAGLGLALAALAGLLVLFHR
jgi:hypothetical protein